MKSRILLLILLSLSLCGCLRETFESVEQAETLLTAVIGAGDQTKTALSPEYSGSYKVNWDADDKIVVFGNNGNSEFSLVEGEGTSSAVFFGTRPHGSLVAFYPSSFNPSIEGSDLLFTLPRIQDYTPGTFADESYPMLASESGSELLFRNLCSVLRVGMIGDCKVSWITLTTRDSRTFVAGTARVSKYGNPLTVSIEEGSTSVGLRCSDVQLDEEYVTYFNLVVPSQVYRGGFTLTIGVGDGEIIKEIRDDVSFSRSQLRSIESLEVWRSDVSEIEWNLLGTGLWRDDLFTSYSYLVGAELACPYAEKEVQVYEHANIPGSFKVANVYTPDYVSYMYAGDDSLADALEGYCIGSDIHINASDPYRVYMGMQFGFNDPYQGYGEVDFASDVKENFPNDHSDAYGIFKNGIINFPASGSIILYLPSAGLAYGNVSGKTRLVMPGYQAGDYSLGLEVLDMQEANGQFVRPVNVAFGEDVSKVKIKVLEGELSNTEINHNLMDFNIWNSCYEMNAPGVFEFTADTSGDYTLLAWSCSRNGDLQEFKSVTFPYYTMSDSHELEIDMYAAPVSGENSIAFGVRGKNIEHAKVALFKAASYEYHRSSIDSDMSDVESGLDYEQLEQMNGGGYTGVFEHLTPGMDYVMLVYADNGFRKEILTHKVSTSGSYTPIEGSYNFYDLLPAPQEDYLDDWTLWSATLTDFSAEGSDRIRYDRGTVTFTGGEVMSLSGMFPTIEWTYSLASDAIDFYYYEGYIYTLITFLQGGLVGGQAVYPVGFTVFDTLNGGYDATIEDYAMIGGFVRNPYDESARDAIAFVASPGASYEHVGIGLCWFGDSSYSTGGYIFGEEIHMYPMLVDSASDYRNAYANLSSDASAARRELSKVFKSAKVNFVETSDGFMKSTIDNCLLSKKHMK